MNVGCSRGFGRTLSQELKGKVYVLFTERPGRLEEGGKWEKLI